MKFHIFLCTFRFDKKALQAMGYTLDQPAFYTACQVKTQIFLILLHDKLMQMLVDFHL